MPAAQDRPLALDARRRKRPRSAPPSASSPALRAPSDPAVVFPVEVFLHILSFLPSAADLAPCARVSKAWHAAAEDQELWAPLTARLWADKVYVPERFKEMLKEGRARDAYRLSLLDSRRDHITKEELCAFTWHWRFKSAAGPPFLLDDPWHLSQPARQRLYLPDGRMGGSMYRADARWRFVRSAEGRTGPEGRFVRVGETPAAVAGRHANWGWYLQSCWSVAASFPLPPPGADPSLEDSALQVTPETQRFEVMCYNSGIVYPDDAVMDRRGFEEVCGGAGWDVSGILEALDGEVGGKEEAEEEGSDGTAGGSERGGSAGASEGTAGGSSASGSEDGDGAEGEGTADRA
ncbi:hypothetical protein DFJ74DRAFT_647355 [Hyaloraphidium curvatum]|nr:hypothetical protein DFJ74DRAFT_647355 [Hyaloraphidium curvatum]